MPKFFQHIFHVIFTQFFAFILRYKKPRVYKINGYTIVDFGDCGVTFHRWSDAVRYIHNSDQSTTGVK